MNRPIYFVKPTPPTVKKATRKMVRYQDVRDAHILGELREKVNNTPDLHIFFTEACPDDMGYNITKELTEKADGCIITDYDVMETVRVDGDDIFRAYDMEFAEMLPDVV